jgi:hypothetical protein
VASIRSAVRLKTASVETCRGDVEIKMSSEPTIDSDEAL